MRTKSFKGSLGSVVILAAAVFFAACQAKIGLYHPESARSQLLAKVFKPLECRLGRTLEVSPAPVAVLSGGVDFRFERPTGFEAVVPVSIHQPSYPYFLTPWSRPPPSRS